LSLNSHILQKQTDLILGSEKVVLKYPDEIKLLSDDQYPAHLKIALIAKIKMSLGEEFRKKGLNVLGLKYEDLVLSPECTIEDLLSKLEVSNAEECYQHDQFLQGYGPGKTQRGRSIDKSSIGKWKDILTTEQGNEIWRLVGSYLEGLGYSK